MVADGKPTIHPGDTVVFVLMQTDPDAFMANLGLSEAFRVGGSVRDELLDREPKDHDYIIRGLDLGAIEDVLCGCNVDKLKPLQLRDGRQVGVRAHRKDIGTLEISLPRKEVSTGPGHRDFKIVCDPHLTLADDAERRDFTINCLYRNVVTDEVFDPTGLGLTDLKNGQIRTTHPDSFRDDPLRTLRALRFASTLGFELAEGTYKEMEEHASSVTALTLKGVSGTALTELEKLLMGANPRYALELMVATGVMMVLLPELTSIIGYAQESAYHTKPLDAHVFDAVQAAAHMEAPLRVRMALLFHDAGKPWMAWSDEDGHKHYYAIPAAEAAAIGAPPSAVYSHEWWGAFLADAALERLNAPAALRRDVKTLIERHMLPLQKVKAIKVRTWRAELGDPMLRDLILHRRCDVLGKGVDRDALHALDLLVAEQHHSIATGVPRAIKDLKINGNDLKDIVGGRQLGQVLSVLLHETMAQPKVNETSWLYQRAQVLARKLSKDPFTGLLEQDA